MAINYIRFVDVGSLMLLSKFRDHSTFGSGDEDF